MTQRFQVQAQATALPPFQSYQHDFVRHLRDPIAFQPPKRVSAKRIGVYVELLRNKVEDSLRNCFPVTRALLGTRRWQGLIRRFIARHRCLSPLYRQIPDEFVAFVQSEWTETSEPPFLGELVHFEWTELSLSIAKDEFSGDSIDPDGSLLEGIPVFAPVLVMLRYVYPVHRIDPDRQPRFFERKEATCILGFRDSADTVHFVELNEATARLIEWLIGGGLSGRDALRRTASGLHSPDPEALTAFGLAILCRLKEQGAILGTRSALSRLTLKE